MNNNNCVERKHVSRCVSALTACLFGLTSTFARATSESELARYVAAPDASYTWSEVNSRRVGSAKATELILTSQTWRGIPWKHQLFVLRPPNMDKTSGQSCCSSMAAAGSRSTRTAPGRSCRAKHCCSRDSPRRSGAGRRAAPGAVRTDVRASRRCADRLHLRSVSADRREGLAAAAADGQEHRACDGRDPGIVASAGRCRSSRSRSRALRSAAGRRG